MISCSIDLTNQYYPWEYINYNEIKFSFKGNIFLDREILNSSRLIDLFSPLLMSNNENKLHQLIEVIASLKGEFAIVIEFQNYIISAVDRVRSIPLFYSKTDCYFVISDDAYCIKNRLKSKIDEINAAEFLVTGYVIGQNTLCDEIKQLEAGEILIYDKAKDNIVSSAYFHFINNDSLDVDENILLDKLDFCFLNVFNRLIESTVNKGMQIVVPLSGGLDSRIIVAMLKRLGVTNVICFTYGNKNDTEVKISERVAKFVGYKWVFVEYTFSEWNGILESTEILEYQRYGCNLVSMAHIQDYLAVKMMKKKGILTEDAVFIPGHSGDMLAGSHIPLLPVNHGSIYNFDECSKQILLKHYSLWNWKQIELIDLFKANIKKTINPITVNDVTSYINALEIFNFKERQSKYIVNSVRVYEYFNYSWRLPLWDPELIDFFTKIPLKYKIAQYLYIKYASEILFSESLEELCNIECTTKLKKGKEPSRSLSAKVFVNFGLRNISKMVGTFKISRHLYRYYIKIQQNKQYIPSSCLRSKDIVDVLNNYPTLKMITIHGSEKVFSYGMNIWSLHHILHIIERENRKE
ncbi:MAG: asparagine synthase-related protein [Methanomethylovorans sp.]|uniref:asparagine synthetase B family protein n=1 Tax=Methanomethylovorans sp. TaxID=2758717 RepID=UPI0035307D2E